MGTELGRAASSSIRYSSSTPISAISELLWSYTSSHAACKMQPVPRASLVMPIHMHLENQSPQGVGHNRIGLGSGSSGSGWTGHCYFTVPEDLRTLKFCAPSMIYDPRRGTLLMQYTPSMLIPCLSSMPSKSRRRFPRAVQITALGPSSFGKACSICRMTK